MGNAWNIVSDVHANEHFRDLDGEDVLAKLARIPIREWNYKSQNASIRHVGPTAQDFRAAFGLGEDDRTISTLDPDGIALRAIQALDEIDVNVPIGKAPTLEAPGDDPTISK